MPALSVESLETVMPKPKLAADAERARLIRLVHVAKRDLRMVDADYQQAVLTASGGRAMSSADLSIVELEKLVSHLKRCGFKVRTKGKSSPAKARSSRPWPADPESKKIRALWLMLHDLGAVKNPSEEALAAYVKRIAKVDALQWINGLQAEILIESMKKWALRFLPNEVQRLASLVRERPLSDDQRYKIASLVHLARTRGTFDPMWSAWQELTTTLQSPSEAKE